MIEDLKFQLLSFDNEKEIFEIKKENILEWIA